MTLTERAADGLHEELFRALPPLPPKPSILDVGCGTGAWLSRFSGLGGRLVGVDNDVSDVGFTGCERLGANLDEDELGLEPGSFDLVTAIEVIEHLENPGRLLHQASHLLAAGGHLLLTTPNVNSVVARVRHLVRGKMRAFDDASDPTHVMPIALPFLEKVLPRHRLAIERLWGYPARGTIMARRSTALALSLVERLFPAVVPGDILCLLARRLP